MLILKHFASRFVTLMHLVSKNASVRYMSAFCLEMESTTTTVSIIMRLSAAR